MLNRTSSLLRRGGILVAALAMVALAGPAQAADEGEGGVRPEVEIKMPVVEIKTNVGTIVAELWPNEAPNTVENFLQYARDGFYDGTIFHRVVPGFVIQGGGYTEEMEKKETRGPIQLEAKAANEPYTLAMARTRDPDSATSQFFINLDRNSMLDPNPSSPGYAVFGQVIEGTSVVDQIARAQTTNRGGMQDVPVTPIVIEQVVVR
jgi:peptidyl-prolyl cis-trans isomerase A (cyclophilin A)